MYKDLFARCIGIISLRLKKILKSRNMKCTRMTEFLIKAHSITRSLKKTFNSNEIPQKKRFLVKAQATKMPEK